ncbi:MAG TPA: DUF4124 domain-containing protein [Burkholderiaceae bacterium]|nr:DUF4124 domain-containing protein [Burkholderiaceae bacterium]
MIWTVRRISLAAAAALLFGAFAMPALAQWAWRDSSGRTVYSDRPPPADVRSDQIMRQPGPGAQTLGTAPSNTNAPAAAPAPDAKGDGKEPAKSGPKTLAEREMEFRKRQQESADAEKKQADEQARNDQRAAECERMRGYLKALEDGQRVARTDAQGNREYLDDDQRAAEVQRMKDGVSRACS